MRGGGNQIINHLEENIAIHFVSFFPKNMIEIDSIIIEARLRILMMIDVGVSLQYCFRYILFSNIVFSDDIVII